MRPHRRGQPDALRRGVEELVEPFERQGEVGAALVPATACTSSTMTVSTRVSVSRAADVSIRNSDSGVVIRMSGGFLISARRSPAGVSPERTPTEISGGVSPAASPSA